MINYNSIEEALNSEGYIITNFEGVSMYPTFLNNDLLIIIKEDKYELYDIVLYKKDNKYVAHRIVDIKDNYYVIRGDNTITDEFIPRSNLLARIDSILRNKEKIKLDYDKNFKDYQKSLHSLAFRKIKHKIRSLLIYE